MLLILSPSKTLDYDTPYDVKEHTQPEFLADSEKLVKKLRGLNKAQIAEMMELSDKLAALNVERFKDFKRPFTPANARQAILAFKGDVYAGMDVSSYKAKDFDFAQQHVRILSGLYGLLRPLDLMQPYRLEMGRKLTIGKTNDLYGFWGEKLAETLDKTVKSDKNRVIINLASNEYAKAVDKKALKTPMIDVIFKEKQGDKLKIVGLFAKKARGLMTDYVIRNRIDTPVALQAFAEAGYYFRSRLSTDSEYVFVRKAS